MSQITYFRDMGEAGQLDYVLLPRALQDKVVKDGTYVHRFKFPEGDGEIAFPGTMRDRHGLPSDHYPVVVTLELPV